MKELVFLDTSAIYALINKKDPSHKKIEDFLKNFKGDIFITNYVFDESVTLIRARLGHEKAVFVGNILLKSPQIEKIWVTPDDEKRAWELFVSRNDKSYSFTDCTSFIVMRRIKIKNCLTLDGHFRQEGFEEI
jgi:predicted nucleic acid-binding protein